MSIKFIIKIILFTLFIGNFVFADTGSIDQVRLLELEQQIKILQDQVQYEIPLAREILKSEVYDKVIDKNNVTFDQSMNDLYNKLGVFVTVMLGILGALGVLLAIYLDKKKQEIEGIELNVRNMKIEFEELLKIKDNIIKKLAKKFYDQQIIHEISDAFYDLDQEVFDVHRVFEILNHIKYKDEIIKHSEYYEILKEGILKTSKNDTLIPYRGKLVALILLFFTKDALSDESFDIGKFITKNTFFYNELKLMIGELNNDIALLIKFLCIFNLNFNKDWNQRYYIYEIIATQYGEVFSRDLIIKYNQEYPDEKNQKITKTFSQYLDGTFFSKINP